MLSMPHLEDNMRVGLFGGSFNPPHLGHLHVAETALKRLGLQKILWLVSPGNPLKNHDHLLSVDERMALSKNLLAGRPNIIPSSLEADLGVHTSYQTIHYLKSRFPRLKFVWVMGADSALNFHHWYQWQQIVLSLPIAIIARPNVDYRLSSSLMAQRYGPFRVNEYEARRLAFKKAPAWCYLHVPLIDVSSSQIRQNHL